MKKLLIGFLFIVSANLFGQTFHDVNSISFRQDAGTTAWTPPSACAGKMIVQVADQSTRFKRNFMIRASMIYDSATCETVRWSTANNVRSYMIY